MSLTPRHIQFIVRAELRVNGYDIFYSVVE